MPRPNPGRRGADQSPCRRDELQGCAHRRRAGPPVGPGLGGECTGEIEAVGAGVTGSTRATRSWRSAAGALATHVCADARLVLPKPPALDHARAAAMPIAGVDRVACAARTGRIQRDSEVPGACRHRRRRLVRRAFRPAGRRRNRRHRGFSGASARSWPRWVSAKFIPPATSRSPPHAPVDVVFGAMPEPQRAGRAAAAAPRRMLYRDRPRRAVPRRRRLPSRPDIRWHRRRARSGRGAGLRRAAAGEVLDEVAAEPTLAAAGSHAAAGATRRTRSRLMMRAAHIGKLVALPAHPSGDPRRRQLSGHRRPRRSRPRDRRLAAAAGRGRRRPAGRGARRGDARDDIVIGDVTDPAALRAVDTHLRARGLPRLRGVIHAAGVLEDGVVASLDAGSFDRVAAPKLRRAASHPGTMAGPGVCWWASPRRERCLAPPGRPPTPRRALRSMLELAARPPPGGPAVTVDWGAWRDHGAAAARGATTALGARDGDDRHLGSNSWRWTRCCSPVCRMRPYSRSIRSRCGKRASSRPCCGSQGPRRRS